MGIPIHQLGRNWIGSKTYYLRHIHANGAGVSDVENQAFDVEDSKKTDWVVSHLTLGRIF